MVMVSSSITACPCRSPHLIIYRPSHIIDQKQKQNSVKFIARDFFRNEPKTQKKKKSKTKTRRLSTNTEIVINSAISTNQVSISIHNNPSMGLQISHYNPIMILKTFREHGAQQTDMVGYWFIIYELNGDASAAAC